MVTLEVVAAKTANPAVPGKMLSRGHKLVLEPDLYPGHRDLLNRLKVSKAWKVLGEATPELQDGPDGAPEEPQPPTARPLYPHQAALIERLRQQRG